MFSTLSIPNWPVNRIISIAIRKTIGKYFILEDSPLSPSLAGLESDLSNGRVVLSGLVLDPSALVNLPLKVLAGHVERIEISLSTPLSLSSSISITLQGLHLELALPDDLPLNQDLAQSLTQSLYEAEDSLAESINQDLPGAFNSSSVPAEPGMISRLIERLLARVSIQAKDVTIRLAIPEAELELRLPNFILTNEEDSKRTVSFFGLGLYFRATAEKVNEMARTDSDTSSGDDLAMSMAIADLRTSDVDLVEEAMEESVYLSAGEDDDEQSDQESQEEPGEDKATAGQRTPEEDERNDWIQMLSFGTDPLGIKLYFGSGLLPMKTSLIIGHITLLLSPEQIATFLSASKHIHLPPSAPSPQPQPSTQVSASIKSFTAFFPYATTTPSDKFWHKPTSPHLDTPHLRLRIHKLHYSPEEINLADVAIMEFDQTLRPILLFSGEVYELPQAADEKCSMEEWKICFPLMEKKSKKVGGAVVCKKVDGWEVDMQPVTLSMDLALMRRCEGLLEVFGSSEGAQAEAKSTAGSPTSHSNSTGSRIRLKCPLARLEVSCSMPEDIMPLGVLTIDIHSLDLTHSCLGTKAEFAALVLMYTQPTESLASTFCSILSSTASCSVSIPPTKAEPIVVDLPLALFDLDKSLLHGLQIWADQITQYFNPKVEEQVIGSKFFGKSVYGKKSLRRNDASSESTSDAESDFETTLHVAVNAPKVVIRLTCSNGSKSSGRIIQVLAQFTEVHFRSRKSDKRDHVTAQISVGGSMLEDLSLNTHCQLLGRTVEGQQRVKPMFKVAFDSFTSTDGVKRSNVNLWLADIRISASTDLLWLGDMLDCLQPPEGVFASAVPADSIEISLTLTTIELHLRSAYRTDCALLMLDCLTYSTHHTPTQPMSIAAIKTGDIRLMLAEKDEQNAFVADSYTTASHFWANRSYIDILSLGSCDMSIRRGNGSVLPDMEGKISNERLTLSVCPDSLATLSALGSEISLIKISNKQTTRKTSSRNSPATSTSLSSSRSAGLVGSVDYRAFSASKMQDSPMDLINDDVPANAQYLCGKTAFKATNKRPTSSLPSQPDTNGESICILDPASFRLEEGYLTAKRYRDEMTVARRACLSRIDVQSEVVSLKLHEGYDWDHTRSAIRAEVKTIRRKLLRVRQMLASGQKATSNLEDTSTNLFNSVSIGLPAGSDEMSDEELAAAIDQELIDSPDDGAWEAVQGVDTGARETNETSTSSPRSAPIAKLKLFRSSAAAIELVFTDVKLSNTSFPITHTTASELRLSSRTFEILDNIETSTWHKFLTELRLGDGGHSRPSDEPMLRVRFAQMRSSRKSTALEARLKLKISPLRLHVDQDAVDFLKRFGSYKNTEAEPASSSAVEAFIQRVEIFPVKIKLDYKPKRVDYAALKGGKTSELMNFFHFDGSEMTLRYISLSDVTGWSRISDMLQDIWTPDVKANQLASVLAGIAPIRSVVNVGSGMADLVLLPIDQYRKDGRVLRGLQKGATSFSKSSALEALRLGARLATGTQVILEKAESIIGARIGSTLSLEAVGPDTRRSRYASQPKTAAAGFKGAYEDLGDNLRTTAQTILAVPMEVYERSATDGSVKAVLRAIPVAILHPAIGASSAVSKTLMGLTNQLDPSDLARQSDKWRQN